MADIKLHKNMFLESSGNVYMLYGGWHKTNLGSIKDTNIFSEILRTHGKKEGKVVRQRASIAIMKSLRVKT